MPPLRASQQISLLVVLLYQLLVPKPSPARGTCSRLKDIVLRNSVSFSYKTSIAQKTLHMPLAGQQGGHSNHKGQSTMQPGREHSPRRTLPNTSKASPRTLFKRSDENPHSPQHFIWAASVWSPFSARPLTPPLSAFTSFDPFPPVNGFL